MPIWSQEAFVSALGLSLLHSLWQGALIGVLGYALHRRLQRAAPEVRTGAFSLLQLTFFAVWLGTFLTLYRVAIRPMVIQMDLFAGTLTTAPSAVSSSSGSSPALLHLPHALVVALVGVWALGVCTLALRHLGGLMLLHRLTRTGIVPCLPAWEECARRLAAQMGVRKQILLRCSAQIDVPCAFGLFTSYVLLPASAMMGLTPEQAEALIAHELAHIARHDVLFNLVQVGLETILFYHPVVWWLSAQIRDAREQRCDDLAVQIIGDRALYARALYSLEEARAATPHLALGAKGDYSRMTNRHLIHRIQRVLGVSGPEKRDPWAKGALALCAAAIGLTTLAPIRAYSRQGQQNPPVKQEQTIKVVTHIMLNINGDQIELNTTQLTPDTIVKVNGKEGRFGDLNATQQQQLQDAVKAIPAPPDGPGDVKVLVHKGDDPNNATTTRVISTNISTKILLNINGDKVELNTTVLKPDTPVKVNDKTGRFGDLTPQQQTELKQTVKSVHIGKGQNKVMVKAVQGSYGTSVSVSTGGKPRIMLNIHGDKVELIADSNDFSTKDLKPDSRVKVNGKEGRFGDLTPQMQQQIRDTNASIHIVTSATTSGDIGFVPGVVKKDVTVKVQTDTPDKP